MTVSFNVNRFEVTSSQRLHAPYSVRFSRMLNRWICDCPNFRFRHMNEGGHCKHIDEVIELLETAPMAELDRLEVK